MSYLDELTDYVIFKSTNPHLDSDVCFDISFKDDVDYVVEKRSTVFKLAKGSPEKESFYIKENKINKEIIKNVSEYNTSEFKDKIISKNAYAISTFVVYFIKGISKEIFRNDEIFNIFFSSLKSFFDCYLFNAGYIGIRKALINYKIELGGRFTKYCEAYIRNELKKAIFYEKSNNFSFLDDEKYNKTTSKIINIFDENEGKYFSVDDLVDLTGFSKEDIIESLDYQRNKNFPLSKEDTFNIEDFSDTNSISYEAINEDKSAILQKIQCAIKGKDLDSLDYNIICYILDHVYFTKNDIKNLQPKSNGLAGHITMDEIAKEFDVSTKTVKRHIDILKDFLSSDLI